MQSAGNTLSWPARLGWFAFNLLFAIVPTLLFFAWVEHDASLPAVGRLLGWPWVDLGIPSALGKMLWNVTPFFVFGFLHSFVAQLGTQGYLRKVVPAPAMRSFYLFVSAGALFVMMGLWQPTGVTVWRLPLAEPVEEWVRAGVFAVIAGGVLWFVVRLGFWDFLGWKQLLAPADETTRTAGTPELRTTGVYGLVRHPVYTGLLAMFLLGPSLSLDRLTVFLAALAYLSVGIPVEERKLIALFGPAYDDYRKQVPALLPISFGPAAARRPAPEVPVS